MIPIMAESEILATIGASKTGNYDVTTQFLNPNFVGYTMKLFAWLLNRS